jgi:hypothetical protein
MIGHLVESESELLRGVSEQTRDPKPQNDGSRADLSARSRLDQPRLQFRKFLPSGEGFTGIS